MRNDSGVADNSPLTVRMMLYQYHKQGSSKEHVYNTCRTQYNAGEHLYRYARFKLECKAFVKEPCFELRTVSEARICASEDS